MTENLWRAQLGWLAEHAPAAVASSLRSRAERVADEPTLRHELAELGYVKQTIDRAARRARGSIRRPRFVRTMALTFIAAALATSQCLAISPRSGGFTKAATKAMEGRFGRYLRVCEGRGVDRSTALLVWRALAEHANQHGFCFPSVSTLAREAGVSERSVQRAIVILEELGFLCVYERHMERLLPPEWADAPDEERAGGRSHMYLLLPAGLEDEPSPAAGGDASDAQSSPPAGSDAAAPTVSAAMVSSAPGVVVSAGAPSDTRRAAPRPGAAPSAVLVAIAPTLEMPEDWARALAEPLARLKGRLGVDVPGWRCHEMAVDLQRGLGAASVAVEQAVQKLLNERAAGNPPNELRCLEVIRFCLQSARSSPVPEPPAQYPLDQLLRDEAKFAAEQRKAAANAVPVPKDLRQMYPPASRGPPKKP